VVILFLSVPSEDHLLAVGREGRVQDLAHIAGQRNQMGLRQFTVGKQPPQGKRREAGAGECEANPPRLVPSIGHADRLRVRLRDQVNTATVPPCVQFRLECIDPGHLTAGEPANRETLALFPSLDRSDITVQVFRDFLPRFQSLPGGKRRRWLWLLHVQYPLRSCTDSGSEALLQDTRPGNPRQCTAE